MGSRHERDHVIDDARTDVHRRAKTIVKTSPSGSGCPPWGPVSVA
jgi:hypothetical protein